LVLSVIKNGQDYFFFFNGNGQEDYNPFIYNHRRPSLPIKSDSLGNPYVARALATTFASFLSLENGNGKFNNLIHQKLKPIHGCLIFPDVEAMALD
jgi:hypothetical protein